MNPLPTFLCNCSEGETLDAMGSALGRVKTMRGLSVKEMGKRIGVCRNMMAKYIAGDAEMSVLKWAAAIQAWPELSTYLEETAAERAIRSRQCSLDLNLPQCRDKAA